MQNRVKKWHNKVGTPWGTAWKAGDIVGCMIDIDKQLVSFSLNGNTLSLVLFGRVSFRFSFGQSTIHWHALFVIVLLLCSKQKVKIWVLPLTRLTCKRGSTLQGHFKAKMRSFWDSKPMFKSTYNILLFVTHFADFFLSLKFIIRNGPLVCCDVM